MIKRPLLCSVCFFVVGVIAAAKGIPFVYVCMGTLLFSVTVFVFKHSMMPFTFLLAVFILLGFFRVQLAEYRRDACVIQLDGKEINLKMTVTDFTDGEGFVAEFWQNGSTHRIYINTEAQQELQPGDIVQATVGIYTPGVDKAGSGGFSSYLLSRRVYLCGSCDYVSLRGKAAQGLKGMIYRVRRYINSVGEKYFSGERRALFNAMILGDKHLMEDALTMKLQAAGLNHIAAVSGLHLSVALAAVTVLLERIFGKRRRGYAVSIVVVLLMTLFTGAGPSVIRACIMCIMYSLSHIVRRDNDNLTSLSVAVFMMTVFNPFVIFNPGFVLSVSAVLGIFLFNSRVTGALEAYLPEKLNKTASVSISAQLITTIPVLYYFNVLTPYCVFTNVPVMPFAETTVVAGMILVLVNKIPFVGAFTATVEKLCISAILAVGDIAKNLPGSVIKFNFKWSFVIFLLFVMVIVYIKNKRRVNLVRISAVFAIIFMIVFFVEGQQKNSINVNCISYGAKDMTALFTPDDNAVLIDCVRSGDAGKIMEGYGKTYYDIAVFTTRNTGSIQKLAEDGTVRTAVVPEFIFDVPSAEAKLEEIRNMGVQVVYLAENEVFSHKNTQIKFYGMPVSGKEKAVVEINCCGKTFVSLQVFSRKETELLRREGVFINCDYLRIPGSSLYDEMSLSYLTNGKALKNEKNLTVNLS